MSKQTQRHKGDEIIAGAFAGAIARMATAPFDVLKIRYQLQFSSVKKYTSIFQSIRTIIAEEGILSLWKGNLSATYLWITYSMLQFSSYEFLKTLGESIPNPFAAHPKMGRSDDLLLDNASGPKSALWSTFILFLAGAGASMTSTAATYPLDLMRTQFAIQGNDKAFPSMRSFITHTYRTNGVAGFYSGLPAAVIGIAPYMGLNFAIYETCKSFVNQLQSLTKEDRSITSQVLSSGFCGAISGGMSKFIVFPLDTVKRRMQVQVLRNTLVGVGTMPTYTHMGQCLVDTVRNEGIAGLYKGITPTIIKSVAATAITFAAYEGAKEFLKTRRRNMELSLRNTAPAPAALRIGPSSLPSTTVASHL